MKKSKLIKIDKENLPEGWCISTIDEISLYIQRGKSPKYTEKSNLPVVNQKCVRWEGVDKTHLKYIHPEQTAQWTSERFLVNGDILWNSTGTGTIGRAALVYLADDEKMVADSHITIIRPAPGMEPKFVHYWIMGSTVQNSIEAVQSGSTNQVELSKSVVQNTPIPLPPSFVQKAIVGKIEELFSHIDAGVQGLKQAKAKLQQYHQSVLRNTVTGKITEQWREENVYKIESANKLLVRILDERRAIWEKEQLKYFTKKGKVPSNDKWKERYTVIEGLSPDELRMYPQLPSCWCYAKLGQLLEDVSYGTSKKCNYNSNGKGVLRIPNIVAGDIDSNDLKFAEFTEDEIDTYRLNEGDILTIRSNGSVSLVGKCAVVSAKDTDYLFAGYLIRLRPVLKFIDPHYLKNVLNSGFLRKQIEALAKSSSGVNNINSGELQSLVIPICTLDEQQAIVQDISAKSIIITSQLEQYEKLLHQASRSKTSILSKAFSGELTGKIKTKDTAKQLLESIAAVKQLQAEKNQLVEKKNIVRAKKMNKRPIIDVLKESKRSLNVEEIFELAGFQNDVSPEGIEVFYQELKEAAEDKFVEVTPVFLGEKKQGDQFKYREVK